MLKRMVGCAFASGGSNSRAAGATNGTNTTSTAAASNAPAASPQTPGRRDDPPADPRSADSRKVQSGASPSASTGISPTPAWASRTPTREELEARRCAEKKYITANDSTETDLWYLIDVEWLSEWKRFVLRAGPLPGPIRNESLVDVRSGRPRPNLELVVHYRGVNSDIWAYWVQRYGGGPAIRRQQLDLYAPQIEDYSFLGVDSALQGGDFGMELPQQLTQQRGQGPNNGHDESAKSGKATSRRSITDLFKSYHGGGRVSRGSANRASADAMASSGASSSRASKSRDTNKADVNDGDSCANLFIKEADACVVPQPMDGSCLFHSLSYGMDDGSDASSLRLDISNYIAGNPDMVIAGTALKDWIKFDSGEKVAAYASEIAGGTWGGGIEIEAFVRLKDVNVHVFETCPGGYRRICVFDAGPGDHRTVTLLYQGREHYDALALSVNAILQGL